MVEVLEIRHVQSALAAVYIDLEPWLELELRYRSRPLKQAELREAPGLGGAGDGPPLALDGLRVEFVRPLGHGGPELLGEVGALESEGFAHLRAFLFFLLRG